MRTPNGYNVSVECACGCGVSVNPSNPKARYVAGHHLALARAARKPRTRRQPHPCECGCGELAGAYERFVRGHSHRGKPRPDLGDGRYINRFGYVLVRNPDHPEARKYGGYVLEHRLVMERTLGRPLTTDEGVHHMNHVKDDNRPENLMLVNRVEHGQKHGRPRGWRMTDEQRERHRARMLRSWAERKTQATPE